MSDASRVEDHMIEIKDLSKIYCSKDGNFYAVNHVSLHVDAGEFLIIMGRSGCGKSTLLNMIGLIDTFDEGNYTLFENDVKSLNYNQLAKIRLTKIGYIYQAYNLIDELNCQDNVELVQGYAGVAKEQRRKRAEALLERVGLLEKAKLYPQQLSGGQQQRIAIARAITNYPQLILADEPTGNLDYKTGIQVMELLKQLNEEGMTIIMVTHDEELTSYASRVIRMKDGELVS